MCVCVCVRERERESQVEEERQHEGEHISQKVSKRDKYVSTKLDPHHDCGFSYLSEEDAYPGSLGSWCVVDGCHAIKPIAWLTGVF